MRKQVLSALCVVVFVTLYTTKASGQEQPRLVVFVSVDQMRADYVDRFSGLFTGGLNRLLTEGSRFTNVYHAHALTETAPGHATLVTGVHPARSGIVTNEWWDRLSGTRSYAAADSAAPILGVPELPGRSPKNLLRTTVGDWLKDQSPDSKVYSVAIKDRVAVLMGGHSPDGAYWYDYDVGRFVTSTYYAERYPSWLDDFNKEISTSEYVGRTWDRLLPEDAYNISRADSFPYEFDGEHITFPHIVDVTDTMSSPFQELAHTPYGDAMTLAMARRLVENEDVGRDDVPDLLFIGASSSDLIGHRYGPFSQEMQDYYVRFDRMLGDFLDFLDEEVGRDRYVTVLTSDHGAAALPEYRQQLGMSGRRIATADFRDQLIGGLTESLHEMTIFAQPAPLLIYPLGLVLAFRGDEVTEEQLEGVRRIVVSRLREAEVLADIITYPELVSGNGDHEFWDAYLRSFHPDRAADILIRYREFDVFPQSIPTNHGSPYDYDKHVPLLIAGNGVAREVFDRKIWTIDVAPTIAMLLNIRPPDDLDGRPIRDFTIGPTGGSR